MQQNEREQQEFQEQQGTAQSSDRSGERNAATATSSCEQQLAAEQQKAKEYLDLLQRTQADFMNYRRRIAQEQTEAREAAQSNLLSQILPVLDDLGRALESAPQELATHPWVQGLFLVARRLTTLLDQLGVKQIGKPGEQFDPHFHEAIATVSKPDVSEGTIVQASQPGYIMNGGRVIRPAQVIVASKPSSAEDTPEP